MKLRGKTIVITGGGSGIGRELVLEALRRGARVAALDVNATSLQEMQALAGDGGSALLTLALDITDRQAVEAMPATVTARLGPIDGVVNNAGIIQPFVRLHELDYRTIDRVFDVNWRGTLYMTKTLLPLLLARPEAHVVNISSMGGFMPFPGQTVYGASKAAVKLLTEGLVSELADTKVRVTIVFPGAVNTNIAANSGVSMRQGAESRRALIHPADRAAREILDGMERDATRILIGKDAKALDVLYRLSPRRAAAFIAKQMKDLVGKQS